MNEDRIFQALSHRTRRALLKTLAEEGPQTYTSLLRRTGLPTGTLNHHLEKLKGLITSENGMYELTEEGWRAYRAIVAVESGEVSRVYAPPFHILVRPGPFFRDLSELRPELVLTSIFVGLLAFLTTVKNFGTLAFIGNGLIPIIFSLLGAKVGYGAKENLRLLASCPATLLPLLLSAITLPHVGVISGLIGLSSELTSAVITKAFLLWHFYLLMNCSRYSLRIGPKDAFAVTAIGIFAGRVVLDTLNAVSLTLG